MSERQGIEIDYCPQCRGIWLDRGELDKIIERSTKEMAPQRPPMPRRPIRSRTMGNQITAARAISGPNHSLKSCLIKLSATGNQSRAAKGSGDPCGASFILFDQT
jgi:Zn-finger nucleic acid-binding protein